MTDNVRQDYETLLAHWDRAFSVSPEQEPDPEEDWKDLAPSVKLREAAASLGRCRNLLDYGCGSGWAGVIAAKSGCPRVVCADPAPGAARAAERCAERFGVSDRVEALAISDAWLAAQPAGSFDGLVCSNVLDVVPPEMAGDILRNAARVLVPGSPVVVGLNFYMPPEAAEKRGTPLADGVKLYVSGVLRLVSRTDDQWREIFSRYFDFIGLDHFAWPGEETERRRLFFLRSRSL